MNDRLIVFASLAAVASVALAGEPALYGETRLSPADYARAKQPGMCFSATSVITPEELGAASRCSLARQAMAGRPPPAPVKDCKDVTPADHRNAEGHWVPVLCRQTGGKP